MDIEGYEEEEKPLFVSNENFNERYNYLRVIIFHFSITMKLILNRIILLLKV